MNDTSLKPLKSEIRNGYGKDEMIVSKAFFTSRAAAESYVTLRSALLRRLARRTRRRGHFAFSRLNAYESI